tara:strand:- start:202 stop:582 length:381 start_codon:yes stop_codon:yes gene_type:complete
MDVLSNLKYTKNHEWVLVEGSIAIIGITDYAQRELGDIVYVEIDTLNQVLNINDTFGTVEAVKTVSDLFVPVTGKVIEVNSLLDSKPELINEDPYNQGWMIKVELDEQSLSSELLSPESYKDLIGL